MNGGLNLPLDPQWTSEDEYVQSLLAFANNSEIFRNLCGGIHILDFLTREPDLFTTVLPQDWRRWFDQVTIDDVLDLLLREPLENVIKGTRVTAGGVENWRGHALPPGTLVDYIGTIRSHCLRRDYVPVPNSTKPMPRHISIGMKPKKIHEVSHLAAYVDELSADLTIAKKRTAIVDFGSGQNYLGRTLASPPYNRHIIAIERRHHNIDGAKGMDVYAKLSEKEKIMRNKKEYKKQLATKNESTNADSIVSLKSMSLGATPVPRSKHQNIAQELAAKQETDRGSMTYVEHDIEYGDLESILYSSDCSTPTGLVAPSSSASPDASPYDFTRPSDNHEGHPDLMVVSLHSCGNLTHHGLRSLVLNPSISAVAMVGCCYNLMTERLGPATYKLPTLRPNHPRLEATSSACDLHGFPMSKTLEDFGHKYGRGVRLNITARMMAVQAPANWGPVDSEAFFRRHFYRALLQRILLDVGVVKQCSDPDSVVGGSVSGKDDWGTPLIVGSLRKSCFTSFEAYVAGALEKLIQDPVDGEMIKEKTKDITDKVVGLYETDWSYAKKNLSIVWSLMAFSAGVVESIVAVDRWLFLREQDCVEKCWVEPIFDYRLSPRNLVVVGIKKRNV